MICEACQLAGDQNSQGNREGAKRLHDQCSGEEQCHCQHRIGMWMQV